MRNTRAVALVVQMLNWTPQGGVRTWSAKAWVQYVQDWPGDQFYNTYPFKRNFCKALNFDKKNEGYQFYMSL